MKSRAGRSLHAWSVMAAAAALLALPALPAQAQNCGKRQFSYWGCLGGQLITKCSECPNNEPGFTPYKRKKPCFHLIAHRPPDIVLRRPNENPLTLFDGSFVTGDFAGAVDFWESIEESCSQEMESCPGSACINMRLSDNPSDFNNDETLLKKDYRTVIAQPFPLNCTDNCQHQNEGIFINMTRQHVFDASGNVKRAPYNFASGGGIGFEAVALQDIMITSMAQFYGLPPQKGVSCGNKTSQPWATDGEAPLSNIPQMLNFSNRDAVICMFRRLYCPGEDPYCFTRAVDENGNEIEASPVEITVTPNPSGGDLVECIITTELRGDAAVAIYDVAGNRVSGDLDLSIQPGTRLYQVKSDLAAGSYLFVLSIDGVNHVRHFIVMPK